MTERQDILDDPGGSPELGANPAYDAVNTIDFGINVFLLSIAALIGLGGLVERGIIIYLLLWNLVLGGYQLLSALVGALRGNRKKLYYLVAAIAYLFILYATVTGLDGLINGDNETFFAGVFLIMLPLGGAVYYTLLCRDSKNGIL